MLGTLVAGVNAVQSGLVYALYGSYRTGSILVSVLKTIFAHFTLIIENLLALLMIFGESVTIFLQDILQYIQNLYNFILTGFEVLAANATGLIHGIYSLFTSVTSAIVAFYKVVFGALWIFTTNIGQIFVIAKKFVILLGSGIWFAITLIPLLVIYFMKLSVTLVQDLMLEIWQLSVDSILKFIAALKNTILFIIDVPVESIFGLLVALSLIYIFIQFNVLIYTYLNQIWCKFKFRVIRLKNRMLTFLTRRQVRNIRIQRPVRTEARPSIRNALERRRNLCETPQTDKGVLNLERTEDKLCVVCQERAKCILLLPCKHVCLCSECYTELSRFYNDTCPICRTDIESTMKIYV